MFKKILAGVDGSDHGYKAASVAGEMARCMDADLWVVTCFESVPGYLGEPNLQQTITERMSQAESVMERALQEIGTISGSLTKEIVEGKPAETILSVAASNGIDLIVVGTRGLGRFSGLILGSQSQKVVSHAECPVLLVR
jgi:nucleotide-binding universal stress UspA family protein